MTEVGVRALRDHLSRYLEQGQSGDEFIVTEGGRAIARLGPIDGERTIDRLIAEGVVTPAPHPARRRLAPLRTVGSISDLVSEQRR